MPAPMMRTDGRSATGGERGTRSFASLRRRNPDQVRRVAAPVKNPSASQPLAGAPLVISDLGGLGADRQPEQMLTSISPAFRQMTILRYCSAYVIPVDALT